MNGCLFFRVKDMLFNLYDVSYITKTPSNCFCIDFYFKNGICFSIKLDNEEERDKVFENLNKLLGGKSL